MIILLNLISIPLGNIKFKYSDSDENYSLFYFSSVIHHLMLCGHASPLLWHAVTMEAVTAFFPASCHLYYLPPTGFQQGLSSYLGVNMNE